MILMAIYRIRIHKQYKAGIIQIAKYGRLNNK